MIKCKFESKNLKTITANLMVSASILAIGCYTVHALGLSAQYYVAVGIVSQMFDVEVK